MKSSTSRANSCLALILTLVACGPGASDANTATGGAPASGGTSAADGGAPSTGGTSTSGGSTGTGGTAASGGSSASGGTATTGGTAGSGGSSGGATGGTSVTPTGGTTDTGGRADSGGSSGTGAGGSTPGGASNTGGSQETGGNAGTGGVSNTGGEPAEPCTWDGAPSSSDGQGQLSCYWFSQGTPNNFPECNGFKTFCGYCGTETGEKPADYQYWCPGEYIQDHVPHISTPHFAAFPQGFFDSGMLCGMCVEVRYGGKTIVATVVDACGSCSDAGHIDLSLSAAVELNMTEWDANPKSGVTWKAVGCPVTDDIYASFNGNYKGQVYFMNPAYPIVSAVAETASGTLEGTMNTGFWMFGGEVGGAKVTLTDVLGHMITGTIPTADEGGSIGAQFDLGCE
ncbi:MAG: hypothetical protein JW940_17675 [Polyangiaceae bacterium]|nr:hypothetical protein [Polyangiaceae bacterium]